MLYLAVEFNGGLDFFDGFVESAFCSVDHRNVVSGDSFTGPVTDLADKSETLLVEFEREMIAQRTKDALQAKKACGARLGGPIRLPAETRARVRVLRASCVSIAPLCRNSTMRASLRATVPCGLDRQYRRRSGRWHSTPRPPVVEPQRRLAVMGRARSQLGRYGSGHCRRC